MDEYVSKPIDPKQLSAAIRTTLKSAKTETAPEPNKSLVKPNIDMETFGRDVVDFEAAMSRVGGDMDAVKTLALVLLEELPKLVSELDSAIERRDAKNTQRVAHTLKGSSSHFFAKGVVEAAGVLEEFGKQSEFEPIPDAVEKLKVEVDRLTNAITTTFV